MLGFFKRFIAERKMPKDKTFAHRAQSAAAKLGRWLIVELSAADAVVIMDQLNLIQRSHADLEEKGRNVMALRYQAIAMSLRTKSGRIPLKWDRETDLLFLASFPQSKISLVLAEIASVSDMPWIDPLYQPPKSENDSQSEEPEPLSDEDLARNPS